MKNNLPPTKTLPFSKQFVGNTPRRTTGEAKSRGVEVDVSGESRNPWYQ
ncbi:hypothetical protein RO575_06890 [Methylomonas sp. MO1]|nr:hypothetical protein [Methylomonas sp. MO1]MDT4289277.1 hypothetical protein [Methylomonas sp. MO1]